MKIALITPLPDPTRWSMQLYAHQLFDSLKKVLEPGRDEVTVLPLPEDQATWSADLNTTKGKLKRYYQQYFAYGMHLRSISADIFHITDHGYANLIPFIKDKKVVLTFHDALLPNLKYNRIPMRHKPWPAILAQDYAMRCLHHASAVIAPSHFSKSELMKYASVPEDKISTIWLGSASCFAEPLPEAILNRYRTQWKIDPAVPSILLIGRTDAHKNMEGALSMLAKVSQTFPNFQIIKVGSPFTADQMKHAKNLQLKAPIYFLGNLPKDQEAIRAAYQISTLLFYPSFYEGFGFPVVEAMASGIPVVCSNRASLAEIVKNYAHSFDPIDETEGVRALLSILKAPAPNQEKLQQARTHAQTFTWDQNARQTADIYRKVLNDPKHS